MIVVIVIIIIVIIIIIIIIISAEVGKVEVMHGRAVKGKLANAVGSQYSSHYLGTCCIQHYYR